MNILEAIKVKFVRPFYKRMKYDSAYKVTGSLSSCEIILPWDHKLPFNQLHYKLYDKKLVHLAKTIYEKSGGICIDIGANVGDSAAAIRMSTKMPIICIEGDSGFYSYLEKNTKALESVTLVKAFVSSEKKVIKGNVIKNEGSGRIITGTVSNEELNFLPLKEILENLKIKLNDVSLLKTDTDGFDFDILLGSMDLITTYKPALFYEYEVNSTESNTKSIELIKQLSNVGYKFIVYDNFGNFFSSVDNNFAQRFTEINTYILSGAKNGGGISYIDVFATVNETIFAQVLKDEVKTY